MRTRSPWQIFSSIKKQAPLIHCITNPISIHQCANAILAVGGHPMMAEHPQEAAEITETTQSLLLNLGNITDIRMKSMKISASVAQRTGIPITLDAVGAACSALRRDFAKELAKAFPLTLIKGNYSEIKALESSGYAAPGVDSAAGLTETAIQKSAVLLARQYNCMVLASGKTDLITDGRQLIKVKNGHPQLASVTGTGCMLGALDACCLSVSPEPMAAAAACGVLGICGQLAATEKGSGSFMTGLMDMLSVLTAESLEKALDMEVLSIEAF